MELLQAKVQQLSKNPIKWVSRGILYYVYTGRNAWHSTWVTQYFNRCMHTTITSAKKYAEESRVSGANKAKTAGSNELLRQERQYVILSWSSFS